MRSARTLTSRGTERSRWTPTCSAWASWWSASASRSVAHPSAARLPWNAGRQLDSALAAAWDALRIGGTAYVRPGAINRCITGINVRAKSPDETGLQLADLVVGPIGRMVLAKPTHEDHKIIESKFRRSPGGHLEGAGLVVLPRERGRGPLRSSQPRSQRWASVAELSRARIASPGFVTEPHSLPMTPETLSWRPEEQCHDRASPSASSSPAASAPSSVPRRLCAESLFHWVVTARRQCSWAKSSLLKRSLGRCSAAATASAGRTTRSSGPSRVL